MAARFTLYYWPIAFRGQFVRAVLAQAGADWEEAGVEALAGIKGQVAAEQPVPFMGPPVLHDRKADLWLAQMPAILDYLGGAFGLMPDDPARRALTHKVIGDANDVLYEMTRHNGAQMWTRGEWDSFVDERLPRWMAIFEETGRRYGLEAERGWLLGSEAPGLADLVSMALWGTMVDKLPALRPVLQEHAGRVANMCARLAEMPEQGALKAKTDAAFGEAWCGGQIEASIRGMLG